MATLYDSRQRIPPSLQRLLDRLAGNPVAVYDAMWNLVVTNHAYDALSGASGWTGIERNGIWRNLAGPGPIAVQTPHELAEQQEGLVADLRMTAAKYPTDRRVQRLVTELRRCSPRFAESSSASKPSPTRLLGPAPRSDIWRC